jgi:hypothetical protein
MPRQLRVRAIAGDNKSASFSLLQADQGAKDLAPVVDLVVRTSAKLSNGGQKQLTVSNAELGLYRTHREDWLEEVLTGFRVKHDMGAQIKVEILSQDFLDLNEFNNAEKF